jgi:hypothetical protein
VNRPAIAIFSICIGVLGGVLITYNMMRERPAAPETAAPAAPVAPAPSRRSSVPVPAPAREGRRPPEAARAEPAPAAPAEAAPVVGVLRIDSDVPGAQIFIDREFVGAAPVTAPGVRPGSHRINVSAPGYDGVAETIDVTPGPRDVMIRLKVVRLDATLDVVHKHRIGSCTGRLVATPQGVRYETTDKDDAFNATMADLEGFEVNYLEKNLRVKIRNGKQYNFADPEGNADRLFVFHRDVDKARERLKKGDPPATQ